MPGLFYTAPLLKIQGLGYRNVEKDTVLMVRKDSRDEFYDVEFFGGQGGAEQVFHLSNSEWYQIAPLLEESLPRGMRKRSQRKVE
jgi:hypothetical protein